MWLLILAGLLAVSAGKETILDAAEKPESSSGNVDDIVMLEIDVKEPVKRSPLTATAEYGAPPNQYILQSADASQGLPPEYLSVAQQYEQSQPQAAAPQRRPQPEYARQQQALQQAYYNFRKPTVVPPRPRLQLTPQAHAQAEAAAEIQAQVDAQNRADAIRLARVGSNGGGYESQSYQPKLGTFEQELLQLVSANEAQEFKLVPTQPKGSSSAYSQQLVGYPAQYAKPAAAPSQLPEQYHIETTPQQYHQQQHHQQQHHQQQQAVAYQPVEEPVQYAVAQPAKAFNPSPQYEPAPSDPHQSALEAQAQAHAQARAEAQALALQKFAQDRYREHFLYAIQVAEPKKQESALEQIQQGAQISNAGRHHLQEQFLPKGSEAAYRAKLKSQVVAQAAETRKLKQATDLKAHTEAIKKLEAQQLAHLKAQENLSHYNMNFEKYQKIAQALANSQALALLKHQARNQHKLSKEIQVIHQNSEDKPNELGLNSYDAAPSSGLPHPNDYYPYDQSQKLHEAGSSHVPRSVPNPKNIESVEVVEAQPITQPRQAHKLKIPSSSQAVYVSDSGLLKKSPIKSLTIEGIVEPVQDRPVIQAAAAKGRTLSEEDLSALINAGYTVTPVPPNAKSAQQIYSADNAAAAYYARKQKTPMLRSEYGYEDVVQRPRKLIRKSASILSQSDSDDDSEKVTYLVPLEPSFGTRQPSLKHEE